MAIQTIKNNIKSNLDDLVTSGVLGAAVITDLKKDPLSGDISAFPCAFVMPPAVESQVLDNRSVIRAYSFDIMVVFQAEDLASTTQLEEKIESILNKFDNDPTLGGAARAGVLPVSSAPEPFQHGTKDMIMVMIRIEAKEDVALTFS